MAEEKENQAAATAGPSQEQSADVAAAPSNGKKHKRRFCRLKPLAWILVVIPTICSAVYFGLIASDQYTSEASFVVRSAKNQSASSGLGALLQSAGFSRSQDDTYTVREYLHSRSALSGLSKNLPVRDFYEKQGDIVSRFNGFGLAGEQEAFYQYFSDKVSVNFDTVAGVSTLRVTAFDAKHAHQINQALLQQGETLINQLNERARKDTVQQAEKVLATAEERVKEASDNLTDYRLKYGVFDLQAQSQAQLGLLSKLQDELIAIQTQLDQVRAVTPENPQIPGLRAREQSLRKEIALQNRVFAGGGNNSLATQAAGYQRVMLENTLAEQQLSAAIAALETAKSDAERQQLYLEVIEQPGLPDMPSHPKRLYNVVATFIIGLISYGILSLLGASIREHKN